MTARESDLVRQRIERLQGPETIRGIVFHAVETAVSEALGANEIDAVKRAAKVSERFDSMSKYPMSEFLRFEQEAASRMAPAVGDFEDAIYRIGAASVSNFFDSLAGKTMALLAGGNPSRLLSAVPNGYKLLTNYGQRSWRQTSPATGTFTFQGEFLGPVHSLGTFETALRMIGATRARVRVEQRGLLDFTLHLEW